MELEEKAITLIQKNFFETRKFRLFSDRVEVEESRFLEQFRYVLPFEHLSDEKIAFKTYSKGSLGGVIGFSILLLIFAYLLRSDIGFLIGFLIVFGILILTCLISFLLSIKKFTGYDSQGRRLLFFKDKPSHEELVSFLESFEKRKKAYLLDRYGYIEPGSRIGEEITKLYWLKDKGALTEEEFQKAKSKLLEDKPEGSSSLYQRFN